MATLAEQIAAFEAKRVSTHAKMTEIMEKAAAEGATLDAEQQEAFDEAQADVKAIDDHLGRLKALEATAIKSAVPATGKNVDDASQSRSGVISVKSNVPKGTAFTRYAIALAAGKGNLMQAAEVSKQWKDTTPEVESVLKAAVAAGTTTDASWAKPLVEYQTMSSEFIELLRPETIIGKLTSLRRVPFNIKMPAQKTGSSVAWVGEGAVKPVSALSFETVTLGHAKAAGIVVLTDELVRFSNPSAEAIVRQDLIASMAEFLDSDFVDPAKAVSAGVSPASITNGVTPVVASGATAAHLKADVQKLFEGFLTANIPLSGAAWIMTATQAMAISMMTNALGQPEFPTVTMTGGTFFGLPVIVSENIPAQEAVEGPPAVAAGSRIILVKQSEILLADDGMVTLDASREASLQMDSSPTTGAAELVSLWQHNLIALRAERFINWQRRRAAAVGYINSAAYKA